MTEERKQEIINDLMTIYEGFEPVRFIPEPTMFWLISNYNATGKNKELMGGSWVEENCPEPLKSLPV